MGPGAQEKLGAPGPTSNVSFVFIYDFLKCKSRTNRKKNSNWNDSKRIFGTEIDKNEIQNCKSLEQNT